VSDRRDNEKAFSSTDCVFVAVGTGASVAGAGVAVGAGASVAVGVGHGIISICERDGRFSFRFDNDAADGFSIFPIPFTGDAGCVVLSVSANDCVGHVGHESQFCEVPEAEQIHPVKREVRAAVSRSVRLNSVAGTLFEMRFTAK